MSDQNKMNEIKEVDDLLNLISQDKYQVFEQLDSSVLTYILNFKNKSIGIFINPPKKPNLLKTDTIIKYYSALNLFKKLRLPIISFVDTPGADPRMSENDKGMIKELNQLTSDIIDYPFFKMGIVYGRCFGGASVISFPEIYGGEKSWAIEDANIGIMGNQIISQLLSGSKRLHSEWEKNILEEKQNLDDYVKLNVVEKVVKLQCFSKQIDEKLTSSLNFSKLKDSYQKVNYQVH